MNEKLGDLLFGLYCILLSAIIIFSCYYSYTRHMKDCIGKKGLNKELTIKTTRQWKKF